MTLGVSSKASRRVLDRLCDAVDGWIQELPSLPFDDRRLHKLRRLILDRRRKLAR